MSSSSSPASAASLNGAADKETRLIRAINYGFRRWAFFLADHTTVAITVCLILSALGAAKMFTTPPENDIAAYSPYGARSRSEFAIYEEFFDESGPGISAFVIVVARDGGSMLRTKMLKAAVKVDDIISDKFPIFNSRLGVNQTFAKFCNSFCTLNEPVRQFAKGFLLQNGLEQQGQMLNHRINLSYPVATMYGREINLQPNFFGLEFSDNRSYTNLKSAQMLALLYRAERLDSWKKTDVWNWETRIADYFSQEYADEPVHVMVMTHTLADKEIRRAGDMMLPFLGVGFVIMATCSLTTTMLSALYMHQVSPGKALLAVMAGVNPFLASATALGALLACGMRNGSILCITPFLVLAIGVDNAYLMVHAWQRVTKRLRNWPLKEDCPGYRLAEVLHDTGPSILISMLTNILADAVGAYTSSPDITLLCVGNLASLLVNFIYQLTIYSSVMLLMGKREMRLETEKRKLQAISYSSEKYYTQRPISDTFGSNSSFNNAVKCGFSTFMDVYSKKITNIFLSLIVLFVWMGYIALSISGITRMNINLTPSKLVASDSIFIEADRIRQEFVIPHFTMTYFFVNNPGNLSDPHRLSLLNKLVTELEQRNDSWGPVATKYFLRDYSSYQRYFVEEAGIATGKSATDFDIDDLKVFLTWPEFQFWNGFLKFENTTDNEIALKSFFFTTAYHGKHLKEWTNRAQLLHQLRSIVDRYQPIFNVSLFHDDAIYMDFIDNMPTDTWQSIVTTLICMGVLCFVFMYNTSAVIVSMAAIASICTGILGLLSWFGVDLDPITMSAMLISIGFSIDVPAHVAYHFHASAYEHGHKLDVADRLKVTIASVGFPAIQAALSTSLCVLSLMLVPLYTSHFWGEMNMIKGSLYGLVLLNSSIYSFPIWLVFSSFFLFFSKRGN